MSRALVPAASASSQAGSSASASVGPKREAAGGVVRSRRASSLAIAAPAKAVPATTVNSRPPRASRRAARRGRRAVPARAGGPGRSPRTGSCRRAPAATGRRPRATASGSATRAPGAGSSTPPIDGSEQQQRPDAQGDDHRVGAAAAGHRRPDQAAIGDAERHEHRDPDDDVERPARPVGQQDEDRRPAPTPRRGRRRAAAVRTDGHA